MLCGQPLEVTTLFRPSIKILSLSLFLGGWVHAQGAGITKPTPPPVAIAEEAKNLSKSEKIQRSGSAVAAMRKALQAVLIKWEEARKTKDVVKLNCVNERLTQIKGLLRISEQSDVAMQEAIAKNENSDGEYSKVTIAHQKITQLREEAEQCIGQLAFQTDEAMSVDVEEPDNLPTGKASSALQESDLVTRPPPASPTM